MALAIDASTPAIASAATSGTTVTTASFTPPAGALLVALIGVDPPTAGSDGSVSSMSNSGTALTWTRRARKNINSGSTGGAGTDGGSEIWTAVVGSSAAMTVTATIGIAVDARVLQVEVLTGADTSSLSNVVASSSASGLPTATLTGCQVGSYVFAVIADWAEKGNATAGSGLTMISQFDQVGKNSVHNLRTTNTLSSAGSQVMNVTAPSAEQYDECVIEILAAAGGGQLWTPGPLVVPGLAAIQASNF